jgi:hypothetical protein
VPDVWGGGGAIEGRPHLPFEHVEDTQLLRCTGSHHRNVVCNGCLLCEECHGHHDDGLCGFDEDWIITIEDTLMQEPKYSGLKGVSVARPTILNGSDAPPRALLKVQQEFIKLRREERHEKVDSSAGICEEN